MPVFPVSSCQTQGIKKSSRIGENFFSFMFQSHFLLLKRIYQPKVQGDRMMNRPELVPVNGSHAPLSLGPAVRGARAGTPAAVRARFLGRSSEIPVTKSSSPA
jgi:hypothetical protein